MAVLGGYDAPTYHNGREDDVLTLPVRIPDFAAPVRMTRHAPTQLQLHNYVRTLFELSPEKRARAMHQMLWVWPQLSAAAALTLHAYEAEPVRKRRRLHIVQQSERRNVRTNTNTIEALVLPVKPDGTFDIDLR